MYAKRLTALTCALADAPASTVVLSSEADARVLALEAALEPRLGPDGDLGQITDWSSKLVGAVVRIAGLLHIAGGAPSDRPVTAATLDAAAQLGTYFLGHALSAFDQMGADPEVEDARALLTWIERTGCQRFTRREIFTGVRSNRFRKVTDVDQALELLEGHEYVRREATAEPGPRGGRPPSPGFVVTPHVLSAERA